MTPDLLLDTTEAGEVSTNEVEENMRGQWPSQAALAAIFRDTTTAELRREWGLADNLATPQQRAPPPPGAEDSQPADQEGSHATTATKTDATPGGTIPSLDQDDLVRQVMNDLKQLGGDPRRKREDMEEVEVETGMQTSHTAPSVQSAGERLGLKIKKKAEDERRRTLKIGGLGVKLPQPREGGAARGSLAAKVQRISCTLTSSSTMPSSSSTEAVPEPLRAKLKRMATMMDAGGPSLQKGHRGTHEKNRERPPLRRRRHLSAV